MSYCKQIGKDKIIFATKEDHEKPPAVPLPDPDPKDQPPRGLIMPNGDINWGCPCLGGMASGPCGYEFREAFSCFHYSKADPKGSDCIEKFSTMQECLNKYPNLYPMDDDDEGLDLESLEDEASKDNNNPKPSTSSTTEKS